MIKNTRVFLKDPVAPAVFQLSMDIPKHHATFLKRKRRDDISQVKNQYSVKIFFYQDRPKGEHNRRGGYRGKDKEEKGEKEKDSEKGKGSEKEKGSEKGKGNERDKDTFKDKGKEKGKYNNNNKYKKNDDNNNNNSNNFKKNYKPENNDKREKSEGGTRITIQGKEQEVKQAEERIKEILSSLKTDTIHLSYTQNNAPILDIIGRKVDQLLEEQGDNDVTCFVDR